VFLKAIQLLIVSIFFSSVQGCATNKNAFWLEGVRLTTEKPIKLGENKYHLVVTGASDSTKEDIVKEFHIKAKEICGGRTYSSEIRIEPYTYKRRAGLFVYSNEANKAIGDVKCE